MQIDFEKLLPEIFSVVKEAGDKLLSVRENYDGQNEIEKNEDGYRSMQTIADLASDKILSDGMSLIFPDLPYISEENSDIAKEKYKDTGILNYTLGDPLDGTSHWRAGRNSFAVLFAVIQGGQPVFGMIYRPAEKIPSGYYGIKGKGAFKFSSGIENNKRIYAIPTIIENGIRVAYETAFTDKERITTACEGMTIVNLADIDQQIVQGYSELGAKLQCMVAEGELDLEAFLMDKCAAGTHDIAPSCIILEEAGAYLTDLFGKKPSFDKPWQKTDPYVVYSNPEVFKHFSTNIFNQYDFIDRVFVKKSEI